MKTYDDYDKLEKLINDFYFLSPNDQKQFVKNIDFYNKMDFSTFMLIFAFWAICSLSVLNYLYA